ncbi:hypothetical protein CAPTEDRAFT_204237 [Capitella teleta]|uniref:CARD domain-containing protein n=1 Tax=Capitella teleta TaxID=283909 RepID=R7V424_CAPTE|nr:hypothetical protein CAPTEDRAFT_204237 [Capitella teleta]|eukprot:ELU13309.1 hypothetical protein CAPTEDRAFT_204237 [Capitella teleta]
MEEIQKELITDNLVPLTRDLDPGQIYTELIAGRVLTFEDKEKISKIDTRKAQSMELISVLLRKGPNAFGVFMNALQCTYPHLYDLLSGGAGNADDICGSLRSELQAYYEESLGSIYPMPWVQRVRLSLNDVYVEHHLKVTTTHKGEETQISTDQLFEPIKEGQKIPRRLLIEGNPGSGKSTICDWLAYKWSQLSNGEARGICSFDLVIYLHAKHLKDQTTIADAIKSHLLPEDFDISSCRLTEDNINHFDCVYSIEGYGKHQQVEHVRRFTEHQKIPFSRLNSLLQSNEVENLGKNPLMLTLLCLLHTEKDVRTRTQTELYSEIHDFILRKVIERMKLTEEDIEHRLLRPLYQLTFEAFENGEDVLLERDFERAGLSSEEVCEVGYLTRDILIRGIKQEQRYSFTHRTFLEFLASKHLVLMAAEERLKWLRKYYFRPNTYRVEEIQRFNFSLLFRVAENVVAFLFGFLQKHPDVLLQMASTVIDATLDRKFFLPFYNSLSLPDGSLCPLSHVFCRLLCELNTMPLVLVTAIAKRLSLCIEVSVGFNCSDRCIKGMAIMYNLCPSESLSISLHIHTQQYTQTNIPLLRELVNFSIIDRVCIHVTDNNHLKNSLHALRIGQADSIKNVKIVKSSVCKDIAPPALPFGDDLRGISLMKYDKWSTRRFLEIVSKKPLIELGVLYCDLDDRCKRCLSNLLLNHDLQSAILVSTNQHMGRFLGRLTGLDKLQKLQISLKEMDQAERQNLEKILKNNTLQELSLFHCEYFADLCNILSNHFSRMTALQLFGVFDSTGFQPIDRILCNLHLLRLQEFKIRCVLNDDNLDAITGAIRLWPNLQVLCIHDQSHELSFADNNIRISLTEGAVQLLIKAIVSCRSLKTLFLHGLQIQDRLIPELCKMLKSLIQLMDFQLIYIHDGTLSEEGFMPLQQFMDQRVEFKCVDYKTFVKECSWAM